ncbi:MAG: YlxR family protein [Coriobacteriia bacterium]|nr:YlxR family protein [Coriobacteriia bacterium]
MIARKVPTRTCVACRESDDKRGLVRVVRTPDGHVEIDPTGKANGRGAYLCATPECFTTARQRRRLDSTLKVNLKDDDYDRLRRDFDELLRTTFGSQAGR